jgi:hypothetical protein
MSTIKQKVAIEKMVENGGVASQAMLEAGYSPNTAKTPQKLTDSKGFKELCEDSGLTDTFLVEALIDDIKTKKGNRKAELELGFKIKGRLVQKTDITSDEKPIPISNIITFEDFSKIDQALSDICTKP